MKNIWLVLKNTFISTVSRRSFILTLILVPLVPFLVMVGVTAFGGKAEIPSISELTGNDTGPQQIGVVDHSDLVKVVPEDLQDLLVMYPNETSAETAVTDKMIRSYAVISEDYLKTGKVVSFGQDFNPMTGISQVDALRGLLNYNLLDGDAAFFEKITYPMDVQKEYLSEAPQRDTDNMLTFFLPYTVTMLFYMIILFSSSLMLSSITDEKQNRVIEILMTSMTPVEMLTGKIVALGLVGLLQTVVWSAAGLALLRFSGSTLNLSSAFQLPISVLLWGILFFLLGYTVYASLMAGIGALVPNLREASQATTIVIMPMVVPLMLINILISKPNHWVSVVLSLFPLTSPVAMMTRISAVPVPLWQLLAAVALLILTAWFLLRATAGMFRAQNLLSGQTFKIKLFLKALIGKA